MKNRLISITRHLRPFIGVTVIGACSFLGPWACNRAQTNQSRFVMIFIDMSLSTLPDRDNYRTYMERIISKLEPGDRITVCKIIDLTIADFTPIFDVTIPPFNFWTDNLTRHEGMVRAVSGQIMATVDSVLQTRPKVQKSEIINSFLICDQFTRNKQGQKSLVIISDMLESSSEFDFNRDELTAEYIDEAIRSLKNKGRIPQLEGVEVWIAGAYAKNTEQYFAVQGFWNRYLAETGAILKSYSHTLLDFE